MASYKTHINDAKNMVVIVITKKNIPIKSIPNMIDSPPQKNGGTRWGNKKVERNEVTNGSTKKPTMDPLHPRKAPGVTFQHWPRAQKKKIKKKLVLFVTLWKLQPFQDSSSNTTTSSFFFLETTHRHEK